jgi:hypothetical protein
MGTFGSRALVLFSVAFFGQQAWSTIVMTLPVAVPVQVSVCQLVLLLLFCG